MKIAIEEFEEPEMRLHRSRHRQRGLTCDGPSRARPTPFARLRHQVKVDDIWTMWEDRAPVGYVFANKEDLLLKINVQILRMDIDVSEAVAPVFSNMKASYIQVTMSRPSHVVNFQRAGWQVTWPTWNAFMVKRCFRN